MLDAFDASVLDSVCSVEAPIDFTDFLTVQRHADLRTLTADFETVPLAGLLAGVL